MTHETVETPKQPPNFNQSYFHNFDHHDDIFGNEKAHEKWERKSSKSLKMLYAAGWLIRNFVRRQKQQNTFVFFGEGSLGDCCLQFGFLRTLKSLPEFADTRFILVVYTEGVTKVTRRYPFTFLFRASFQRELAKSAHAINGLAGLFAQETILVHRKEFLRRPHYRVWLLLKLYRLHARYVFLPWSIRHVMLYDVVAWAMNPEQIIARRLALKPPPFWYPQTEDFNLRRRADFSYNRRGEQFAQSLLPDAQDLDFSAWHSPYAEDWFGVNPHVLDGLWMTLEQTLGKQFPRALIPLQLESTDTTHPDYIIVSIGTTVSWKNLSWFVWGQLLGALLAELPHDIVLVSTTKNAVILDQLYGHITDRKRVRRLYELPDIKTYAQTIARAKLSISEDTGHAHLAKHVGTPQLTLLNEFHDNVSCAHGIFIPYPPGTLSAAKQAYMKVMFDDFHCLDSRLAQEFFIPAAVAAVTDLLANTNEQVYRGIDPRVVRMSAQS